MQDLVGRNDAAYHASAWMGELVDCIEAAGALEGDLRREVAEVVEAFRTFGVGGDPDQWRYPLWDRYVEFFGRVPERA